MKTITVRDLRQRWPEAERSLQTEKELIVTRNGKPVAKLIRHEEEEKPRKRFDPAENRKWLEREFGKDKTVNWVEETLLKERYE